MSEPFSPLPWMRRILGVVVPALVLVAASSTQASSSPPDFETPSDSELIDQGYAKVVESGQVLWMLPSAGVASATPN